MASYMELTARYNFWYALWAWIEYHTEGWIEDFAQRQMNNISMKKYNKDVFWKPLSVPQEK